MTRRVEPLTLGAPPGGPGAQGRRAARGRARPTAAHFFGAEASLAFAVMEDEAAPDADQTPAEKAAVMIQRMHRQNSFTSEDSDEKARRQWVNFHLANGQYEEASLWDGTAISEKNCASAHTR